MYVINVLEGPVDDLQTSENAQRKTIWSALL